VARGKGHTALIFGAGCLFCAELVWAYPATAVDVFGYVAHGRLVALHGVNPFMVAPADFPDDAIMAYLAVPTEPSRCGRSAVLLVPRAGVAGALVKVPVVLTAPLRFIGMLLCRPARALEGALLAVALAAVLYRPFWEGP